MEYSECYFRSGKHRISKYSSQCKHNKKLRRLYDIRDGLREIIRWKGEVCNTMCGQLKILWYERGKLRVEIQNNVCGSKKERCILE